MNEPPPVVPHSIWSDITTGEVVLFIVGIVFTIGIVTMFIWLTFRLGREEPPEAQNQPGGDAPAGSGQDDDDQAGATGKTPGG